MSLRQIGTEKVTALVNAFKSLITTHNNSSSAHSTEMAKKVNINQGSNNSGKFLKVDNSGNVACESVTIPSAYTHPQTKQCNYSYSHPSAKQCNATIPSASSSIPSVDVTGGAIGSSSNYAKADHQHPLSSAYATASHNQDLSTINNVSTVQVVVTYTDSTSETLNLVKYTGS